jgi:CelD/BcsL family acetyltransferase involved in cellulose biosynthesis
MTNHLVVDPEDFNSYTGYFADPGLHLKWNLVFTLPSWLKVWWQYFSSNSELYLRSVKLDGKIIGLAPLRIQDGIASFIGSVNVCDYLDFILQPGHERDFFDSILDDLKQNSIHKLHLETIRPDSTIVSYLMPLACERGYKIDYHQTDVSSDLVLPASWDEYLAILNRKQRHEIKRKIHNLNDLGQTIYRSVTDQNLIPGIADSFLDLFPDSRRDKAKFLTFEMKSFFRSLATSLSKESIVGFGSLEFSGQPLAIVMYFLYNDNIYLYNSAYNPDYKSFSVGIISKALCIQDSILNRKTRFDFLKGSERYKSYLGGQEIPLFSCDIFLD